MRKRQIVALLLVTAVALTGFVSCDLLFGPTGDSGDSGSSDSYTLVVDVKPSYFTALSISSVDVYVNSEKVGTINSSSLDSTSEYDQFSFSYTDPITSLRFTSSKYSNTFDEFSDFWNDEELPTSITSMSQIKKVILGYSYDWWSEVYSGTGAYIGPRQPDFFNITSITDSSATIYFTSETESPEDLFFNIYLSTDGGSSYTKYNSTAVEASDMFDDYTLTELNPGTDYNMVLESVYEGISSYKSTSKTFSTDDVKWTVMVWLDGDNDLNPMAVQDYLEMEDGLFQAQTYDSDITENLDIIVRYDNNPSYDVDDTSPGIYLVQPNAKSKSRSVLSGSTALLKGTSDPNMGSAEELADFIDYSKTNYPADKYALILWNHGGGVRSTRSPLDTKDEVSRAICWDYTNGEDALYVGEIKDYLNSTHSVDFLGMDACLMGFLEVAYEFRPGTDDFGAQAISFSPATEQGDGWEYDQIFSRFSGSTLNEEDGRKNYLITQVSPQTFATIVAQEYGDAFSSYSAETQTAVDLTKISAVKSASDIFANKVSGYKSAVESIRGAVLSPNLMNYFDDDDSGEWYEYAGFDLYELAEKVKSSSSISGADTAATNLMNAIDEAILFSFAGSSYGSSYEPGKNGLAIFFPHGDASYGSHTYWAYQHWYNNVSRTDYTSWWGSEAPPYGGIDFCTSDGDGTVESWFELLQYWFNPDSSLPPDNSYNPSPLE